MLLIHTKVNVDQEYNIVFKQSVHMADQLKIEPKIPRIAKKQIHRDSVLANSSEEYYKKALAIQTVDS